MSYPKISQETQDFVGSWGFPGGTAPWVDSEILIEWLNNPDKTLWVEPEKQAQWESFTKDEKKYVEAWLFEWLYGGG